MILLELFGIDEKYKAVVRNLENEAGENYGEVSDHIWEALEAISFERNELILNSAMIAKSAEKTADAIDLRIKELQSKKKSMLLMSDAIRDKICVVLKHRESIKNEECSVLKTESKSIKDLDQEVLKFNYGEYHNVIKRTEDFKLDKVEVKRIIKEGKNIPFVEFETKEGVRIS